MPTARDSITAIAALLEKLRRKLSKKLTADPSERDAIRALVENDPRLSVLLEWTSIDAGWADSGSPAAARLVSQLAAKAGRETAYNFYYRTDRPPVLGKAVLAAYATYIQKDLRCLFDVTTEGEIFWSLYQSIAPPGLPPEVETLFAAAKKNGLWAAANWDAGDPDHLQNDMDHHIRLAIRYGWGENLAVYEKTLMDHFVAQSNGGAAWSFGLTTLKKLSAESLAVIDGMFADETENPAKRRHAITILGEFRRDDPAMQRRFGEAVKNPALAKNAIDALARSRTGDPAIHRMILQGFENPETSGSAIVALTAVESHDPVVHLAVTKQLHTHKDYGPRINQWLRLCRANDRAVLHELADMLETQRPDVTQAILDTFRSFGAADEYVIRRIEKLKKIEDGTLARQAVKTLRELGPPVKCSTALSKNK